MKNRLFINALFVLIFFCACKKEKKDKTSPSIAISNPGSGQAFNMFDTLNVSAKVSDETKLTSVVVSLVDINNIVLQYSYSVPIQSNDFTFNIKYVLNEFHISSGSYYMSVTANDGSNITQRTVQINITESPTLKTGYFIVGATQPKTVVEYDANMVPQSSYALSTGFNGMAFGAYYQQLYINGNINQAFTAYDATMNGMTWQYPYGGGGGMPVFTCVSTDGQKAYIGYYSGSVGAATYTGGSSTGYSNGSTTLYPYFFTVTGSYGIGIYKDKTGGGDKILSFYRSSGTALNNTYMPITVLGVFERTTSELYVVGNTAAGQAVYYLYNVSTNGLVGPFSLPSGKLLSVAQADNDFLILAMNDGNIYGHRYSNGNTTVLDNTRAQKIIYNPKMKQLNAASDNKIYSYSLSTNYVLSLSGFQALSDSIIGFEVITNK